MSIRVAVLCECPFHLSLEQIADFIASGVFFDEEVRYQTSPENQNHSWETLSIHYEPTKRPIVIEKLVSPEIEPIIDDVAPNDLDLQERIKRTQRIYLFELGAFATEDAWDAAASLQILICQAGSGIVVAAEGIYDDHLKLVLPFI
jgi:hypothetical protein